MISHVPEDLLEKRMRDAIWTEAKGETRQEMLGVAKYVSDTMKATDERVLEELAKLLLCLVVRGGYEDLF